MPNSRKSPTPGWKPATTRPSNEITRATLKARADAATARRRPTLQEEVEASKKKYKWGGPNSYPRRWNDSQSTGRSHPVLEPSRRISRTAATRLGDARSETHDATDHKARTFASLQKKDLRRARGDKSHLKRGRAFNPAHVPRKISPRGHASTSGVSSTLSPEPAYDVSDFQPDSIEIGPDGSIAVSGKITMPPDQLVNFLKTPHHPLVYLRRPRADPAQWTADVVDAEPSSMAELTRTAGPTVPSGMEEPTPVASPTAHLPLAESTPAAGPTLPSSIAEPTSVAASAPAAPSSVAGLMPVTESAAEAPSSLAEPTPSPAEPMPVARSSTAEPTLDAVTPSEREQHDEQYEAWRHKILKRLATGAARRHTIDKRRATRRSSSTSEAARPSVIPSRPGVTRSTGDGPNECDGATPRSLTRGAAQTGVIPSLPGVIHLTGDPACLVLPHEEDSALPSPRDEVGTSSPNDTAGPVSTMASDDDDWVLVDIPAPPTNPWGGIDYTRLDLADVDLVPSWRAYLWWRDYGHDATRVEANEIARRSIFTKYLERQLQADRILTISNFDFGVMQGCSDLAPIYMTDVERKSARARGLTHTWDCKEDLFLRVKEGYE